MDESATAQMPLKPAQNPAPVGPLWLGWIPLIVLPAGACLLRSRIAPWQFMWLLSIAIFFGCKWETWFGARADGAHASVGRNLGYLFLWPGMDAATFLDAGRHPSPVPAREWLAATAKSFFGAFLIWFVVRRMPAGHELLAGWIGMLGLVLVLHFGAFNLIALIWKAAGIDRSSRSAF